MVKKPKKIICVLLVIFTVLPLLSYAGHGWRFWAASRDVNSKFHKRFIGDFKDDITPDQNVKNIKLTPAQIHEAQVWGLSTKQEKRYIALMQNQSGVYYGGKHLSPVEILGLNARTDIERNGYAEIAAKQTAQRIAKELAFNSAYHNAYVKLMEKKGLKVVRPFKTSTHDNTAPISLQKNDKLMLFVRRQDNAQPVISFITGAIQKDSSIRLNIYFADKTITKDQIFSWAKSQNIPTDLVHKKRITLNFGYQRYAALNEKSDTPALYLIRDGKTQETDISRF